MRFLQLLLILLFFPLFFYAQTSLTGLWVGTLDNDSATVRKDQAFEIALTEYRGKVYGYSRMTFTVNDTLYYIIKRVKGTIDNEICEVKDDEIVRHNFPRNPDKGVKLISTFRRNMQDSIWKLDGEWKTTETKRHRYYSISGKISLTSEPDITKSKLFPHLEELNLAKNVEFYAEAKKKEASSADIAYQNAVVKETLPTQQTTPVKNDNPQPPQQTALNTTNSNDVARAANEKTEQPKPEPTLEEALAATSLKNTSTPVSHITADKKQIETSNSRPEIKNQVSVKETKPAIPEEPSKTETKKIDPSEMAKLEPEKTITPTPVPKPVITASSAAVFVAERKMAESQVLTFKSDSLVIKLYDNGEIDGDTVSVLLNGEVLLAKQGLKASAIKKTIYIQPGQDELNLVLYAENLGKYPPNTGLLVVDDGDATYQIRFSADFQQNAAVIFRRKK